MHYSCQNTNLYYSFEEGNSKIFQAFALKDIACGTTHTITKYLQGNSYKRDVDACVNSIIALDCEKWKSSNPTPITCFGINTRWK